MPTTPDHLGKPGVLRTAFLLVAGVGVVAGYDLWALKKYGRDATITGVVQAAARTFPVLTAGTAFSMGALFGHFFLTGKRDPSNQS